MTRLHGRDFVNLGSQVLVKLVSIPFGIGMVGFAVRHLPRSDDYLLLSATNYISFVGLLQIGLGSFILRRLAHEWAQSGHFGVMPEVRSAFLLVLVISVSAIMCLTGALALQRIPIGIFPLVSVALIALWASFADMVRLARGEVFITNLILLSSYLICGCLMGVLMWSGSHNLALAIFAAFAPTYVSSIVSFLSLWRRAYFRELISMRSTFTIRTPIVEAVPLLLVSFAAVLLLNAPLASTIIPSFPALSLASLACLRLFTSVLNVYYFALQPLFPIILRFRYSPNGRFVNVASVFLAALLLLDLTIAIGFAFTSPTFIHFWLGGGVFVSSQLAFRWGVISCLWLVLLSTVYFCQFMYRAWTAAGALFVATAIAVATVLLGLCATIEDAMLIGLLVGASMGIIGVVYILCEGRHGTVGTGIAVNTK